MPTLDKWYVVTYGLDDKGKDRVVIVGNVSGMTGIKTGTRITTDVIHEEWRRFFSIAHYVPMFIHTLDGMTFELGTRRTPNEELEDGPT